MREEELRSVLLVKAVEEADPDGRLIPAADRVAAAREAKRGAGDPSTEAAEGGRDALAPAHQRLLVARARTLLSQLAVRHPFVQGVHALAGRVPWAGWALIALGLLAGGALSALDGSRRIEIVAFPLLGLVAWNVAVYLWLAVRAILALRRREGPPGRWLPRLLAEGGASLLARMAARSRAFHAQLAEAMGRFGREWFGAARPLLVARATRVLHLAAAAVGVGLVAGLYVRGIGLDYQAGWSSTFLDAAQAHRLATWIYGPASWLTGIAIPDAAQFEALRWESPGGGERAARWIHLLAATAAIFVVVPRLVLAAASTVAVARRSLRAPLPADLPAYFRATFASVSGVIDRGVVMVAPYAYEPGGDALERLRAWLPSVVGAAMPVDLRMPVAYGDEDDFVAQFAERGGASADVVVVLLNMAATPEDENHGTFLAGVRDWLARERPQAQLVVAVDEAPYAARMGSESGMAGRVEERRAAWRDFVRARGLEARFVRLAP